MVNCQGLMGSGIYGALMMQERLPWVFTRARPERGRAMLGLYSCLREHREGRPLLVLGGEGCGVR